MENSVAKTRFCVIGAGAAGICAARRLQEDAAQNGKLEQLEICVFEQSSELGGTWVLDGSSTAPMSLFDGGVDACDVRTSKPPHSSMYAGLRTNFPRELMQFRDFPFPTGLPTDSSFPGSAKVLEYLQQFAQPIVHLIQFNCRVLSVRPLPAAAEHFPNKLNDGGATTTSLPPRWAVTIQQQQQSAGLSPPPSSSITTIQHFDAVFSAVGHYSTPWLPAFVSRLRALPWLHSHSYRRAEHFAGKNVAVVGAGSSGTDIAQLLAKQAEKVYFLHMPAPTFSSKNCTKMMTDSDTILIEADGQHNGNCQQQQQQRSPCSMFFGTHYWTDAERPANCVEMCRPMDVTADGSGLVLADGTLVKTKMNKGSEHSAALLEAANGDADERDADNGKWSDKDNIFVDCVIFCTGYRYSLPFLESTGLIECADDGARVSPIWAHFVHPRYPHSLFLLGLAYWVVPFPLFDRQMQLAIALFYGRVKCPSEAEMLEWQQRRMKEIREKRLSSRHFHQMATADEFYAYLDWLDTVAGHPERKYPPVLRKIHEHVYERRKRVRNTDANRNVRYVVQNEREFVMLELGTAAATISGE